MREPLHRFADIYYGKSPSEVLTLDSEIPIFGTGGRYGSATRPLFNGPAVVVARKGSLGTPHLSLAPFWASDTTYAVLPRPGVDARWLYYSLSLFDLTKLNEATGVPSINRDWLRRIELESVAPDQQRRIAEILGTVDEAIEQTEALIAKQQQVKAGLMHDLFTRGVTPDGCLRPVRDQAPNLYKESPLGWIPKEWGVAPLSSVVEFLDGQRIPLKEDDRAQMEGSIPYYGASGIIDYIDRWLFDDDLILLGEDGENIVSRNLPLAFRVTGKCWINNHAHVLKPKAEHDIDFWTDHLEWRDYSGMTSGSAQPKITQGHLRKMLVPFLTRAEQRSIANFLSSQSTSLVTETAHLTKLRQQKQGLMQDLLTGRVPVKVTAGPSSKPVQLEIFPAS